MINGYMSIRIMSALSLFFLQVPLTFPQKMSMGYCPIVSRVADFDLEKFMGVWYQQATVSSVLKDDVTCTKYTYKPGKHGSFIIDSKMTSKSGELLEIHGVAKPKRHNHEIEAGHFSVISRDESLEILSRERMFNTSVIVSAFPEVRRQRLEEVYGRIHTVDQLNCTDVQEDLSSFFPLEHRVGCCGALGSADKGNVISALVCGIGRMRYDRHTCAQIASEDVNPFSSRTPRAADLGSPYHTYQLMPQTFQSPRNIRPYSLADVTYGRRNVCPVKQ
ncbi:hypothetical protein J6590_055275 [Homalodisca vitripennis]|nr:hypothetical protein J6590_055275 [Homalodisca vitripennis]